MFLSSSMPSLFGRPETVIAGNETLQALIVELRDLRPSLASGVPEAACDARRLLSDFSAELYAYFDAEEDDDYFGTIVEDCPTLRRRVEKLGAAHAGFRDSVGALRRLAGDGNDGSELAVRVERVLVDLEEHERSECLVLRDFFRICQDTDGG